MTWLKMLVLVILVNVTANGFVVMFKNYTMPPRCFPVLAEQATVCMSWRPFRQDFLEVNRIPFTPQLPPQPQPEAVQI